MSTSLIQIDPKLVDQLVKEHIQVAVTEAIRKNGAERLNRAIRTIKEQQAEALIEATACERPSTHVTQVTEGLVRRG